MTQHVRDSYRDHRKATWALVLGVVALIATVVIPFATGAPSKYYTLDASPEPTCSTPTRQTFTLTLSNKTRNQNLGSANIEAPSYIQLVTGSTALLSVSGQVTVNEPDGFGDTANTIRLRNLALPTNTSTATITVEADVIPGSGETWTSIAKQSNNFADTGPGNLFAPLPTGTGSPPATVTACAFEYVFVDQPDVRNAEKGSAQTVQVQLQSNGNAVPVSESLTLGALQNGQAIANPDPAVFTGLTAEPDTGGPFAGKQWTFSVTGKVSGTGYALQAGDTVSNPTFSIADGICNKDTVDSQHLASNCSLTSDLGGLFESGVTINNHKLDPISINFAAGSTANNKCADWTRASYTVDGQPEPYFFPGVELDLTWGGGVLQVIYRVRNADWVLTEATRGNQDIQICVGAKHQDASKNGDGSSPNHDPFTTKFGVNAAWDGELYWGVLPTVQNPSKVKAEGDPAVCGRGTQDLPTGPSLSLETWRTWTICIPFDWDWKNFG